MAINGAEKIAVGYSPWASVLYALGLVLVFVGERLVGTGNVSTGFTVAGVAFALAALGAQGTRLSRRGAGDRSAEKALLALYGVGLGALLFYFLTSNVWFHLTGYTLQKTHPRLDAVLETLWPALMLLGILPVLLIELSLATMARAPVRDHSRVRAAMWSGLGIGFALVFVFSFAFVASERDKKVDLSYFRVARAGESTLKLAETLDKPVEVFLFFPPANEVLVEVESYFEDLKSRSDQIKVEILDHAIHPAKAKELGVSGNGIIVMGRDKVHEQIGVPLQLERARDQLKKLDQEVQKRLLGVTRPPRVAYLTQGHGEMSGRSVGDTDLRGTVKLLREHLLDQGYEVKDLGLAEGLGGEVPADATIVLILGPTHEFLDEEAAALDRFIQRQGRVFIAANPEEGATLENLLAPLGLAFRPTLLAHDQVFWRRTRQISDRTNTVAANFSSHVSVTNLSKYGSRAPVVFPGAGYLEKHGGGTGGLTNVRFNVRSDAKTWNDLNGNFEYDSDESRKIYELAATVTKRTASAVLPEEEGRAVVLADADAVSDAIIARIQGNQMLFVDAIRWLGGEERIVGRVNTEEDVPIVHTRKQDLIWFYGTVFLAPTLVLALGFVMTRKNRRGRGRRPDGGSPPDQTHANAPPEDGAPLATADTRDTQVQPRRADTEPQPPVAEPEEQQ